MHKQEVLQKLKLPDAFQGFVPRTESKCWGWHSKEEVFDRLVGDLRPKTVIEVGSWMGLSAVLLARSLKKYGCRDASVICVDTWLGSKEHWQDPEHRPHLGLYYGYPSFYFNFLSNMIVQGVSDAIVPLPMTSTIAARILGDAQVSADLIYLDGSHDYEDVLTDLNHYWKLLNPGGVFVGDDWTYPGVEAAAREFSSRTGVAVDLQSDGETWLMRN